MSRCFPFPPPGYFRNTDALKLNNNEPIKIHLDIEKPKKDRKEKKDKKERKERKREKKEKRKGDKEKKHHEDSKTSLANSATSIKFKPLDEIKEKPEYNAKLLQLQKGLDYENEQLERSGITEELDQPVSSPQEPYSSDSSQSSKRKRSTLLQPSKEHGPAIRIRLPLRKHQEPEESKHVYQLGSSSSNVRVAVSLTQQTSRIDRPLQHITKVENKQLPGSSDSKVCKPLQCIAKVEIKQHPGKSDSKVCKPLQNLVTVDTHAANEKVDRVSRKMESLYNSLLHIQPITYDQFDSLDQDWLFSSVPTEAKPVSKKPKTEVLQCSKSVWPRAQYMPEVDIYALPYTVPF